MKIKLSKSGYRVLSQTTGNYSAVFLGTVVIAPLIGEFEIAQLPLVILGLLFTILTLYLAMGFGERGKL